jgi:hypothetical protein
VYPQAPPMDTGMTQQPGMMPGTGGQMDPSMLLALLMQMGGQGVQGMPPGMAPPRLPPQGPPMAPGGMMMGGPGPGAGQPDMGLLAALLGAAQAPQDPYMG